MRRLIMILALGTMLCGVANAGIIRGTVHYGKPVVKETAKVAAGTAKFGFKATKKIVKTTAKFGFKATKKIAKTTWTIVY